jgi:hypothetical protein
VDARSYRPEGAGPGTRRIEEEKMPRLLRRLGTKGRDAARKAYEKVETRILVAEGRKAVREKAHTVAKVSQKAAKTGLLVGAMAAAGVVLREIKKRRGARD